MNTATEKHATSKPDVMSYRDALLPKGKPGFAAYSVWLVSLSFVLFQFFVQLSAGEIIAGLMKSFNLTAFGASLLTSAYYYTYVPLQTPAGILMDRFGPRRLCTAGAVVLLLGIFMMGAANWALWVFVARMLMGLGAAFAFVGCLYLADKWFPRERFSLLVGVTEASAMLIILLASGSLAALVERFGWRVSMFVSAAVMGVIAVLYGVVVRDQPPSRRVPGRRVRRKILPGLRVLIRMKVAWINGCYSGIMFSCVAVFATMWAIPFFQHARQISLTHATFLTSIVCGGVALGAVLLGWLDAHIPVRRYALFLSSVVVTLLLLVLIWDPTMPVVLLVSALFFLGFFASTYMLNYTIANEIAALRIRSASIGFVNTLSVGSAPLLQPLIGFCLYLLASHDHPTSMTLYTLHEYQASLTLLPLLTGVAAWLSLYLPSRRI